MHRCGMREGGSTGESLVRVVEVRSEGVGVGCGRWGAGVGVGIQA